MPDTRYLLDAPTTSIPMVRAPIAVQPKRSRWSGRKARSAVPQTNVWWLSPVWLPLVMTPVAVLLTVTISDERFRSQWDSPKTITWDIGFLLMAGGLVLALGAALVLGSRPLRPRPGRWPALTEREERLLVKVGTFLVVLTAIGYAAFVWTAWQSGLSTQRILSTFGSEGLVGGDVKRSIYTIPGLTTLTQCGLASVVVSAILLSQRFKRKQLIQLLLVVGLALPRAFLRSERLAFLELVVPIVVVIVFRLSYNPRLRRIVGLLPVIGLPFLITVFAGAEYFRSWVYFRSRTSVPFAQWSLERLAGYYSTALNNGALELVHKPAGRWPYQLMAAVWTAPGISNQNLYQRLSGFDYTQEFKDLLRNYGNPDFNNSSGLAAPFVDLGTVGGLIFLFGCGIALGLMYRSFKESSYFGMIAYPIFFIGLVELPRIMDWTHGRIVPAWLAAAVVAVVMRRATRPNPLATPVFLAKKVAAKKVAAEKVTAEKAAADGVEARRADVLV